MSEMTKGVLLGAGLMAVGFVLAFVLLSVRPSDESPSAAEVSTRPTEGPSVEPPAAAAPVPTPQSSRTDCNAIRGTGYRDDAERAFFLANCVQLPSAPTTSGAGPVQTSAQPNSTAPTPVLDQDLPVYRPTPIYNIFPEPTPAPAVPTSTVPYDPDDYLSSTNPPKDFCDYVDCIPSFWSGTSFVVQCRDGVYAKTGSRSPSCAEHGGVGRQ